MFLFLRKSYEHEIRFPFLISSKEKLEQEAFGERKHFHVYDLLPSDVTLTLTLRQGQKGYVIGCRLLYCTLVPGMIVCGCINYDIW